MQPLLTLALDEDERLASSFGCFCLV